MILTNTANTGYSLGAPLYWPSEIPIAAASLIQGLSINIQLTEAMPTVPELFLTKYTVERGRISLAISGDGLFCSMDGELPNGYALYPLVGEAKEFIAGWVCIYAPEDIGTINISGARINPLYVHANPPITTSAYYFELYDEVANFGQPIASTLVASADGRQLFPTSSPDVSVSTNSRGDAATYSVNGGVATSAAAVDSTSIYYINGSRVSSGGVFTLSIPETWTVHANGLCAYIANTSTKTSCVDNNYIVEMLGPQNYPDSASNPLRSAFSDGELNLDPIYAGTVRFNSEYEGNGGLIWSSLSDQHDGITDGGTV